MGSHRCKEKELYLRGLLLRVIPISSWHKEDP
jgi:hypothetical protein